jgi:hypothetical protein
MTDAISHAATPSIEISFTLREWQTYIKEPQTLIVQASRIDGSDGWQPYPIGMSWQYVQIPQNQRDVQLGPHDTLVLCAITDTTDIQRRGRQSINRRAILNTLAVNGIHNGKMDGRAYYFTLPQYKFVVSPEGNGIDCHRHYEAILAGCIPIIEDNPLMMEKYKGLPVLWTHDYSEITQPYLEDKYNKMLDSSYNFSSLFLPNYSAELQEKIKHEGNYWCDRVAHQKFYI